MNIFRNIRVPIQLILKLLVYFLLFRAILCVILEFFEFISDLAMKFDERVVEEKSGFQFIFEKAAFPPEFQFGQFSVVVRIALQEIQELCDGFQSFAEIETALGRFFYPGRCVLGCGELDSVKDVWRVGLAEH